MLGYGIGIIILNVGLYFVFPALVIKKLRNYLRKYMKITYPTNTFTRVFFMVILMLTLSIVYLTQESISQTTGGSVEILSSTFCGKTIDQFNVINGTENDDRLRGTPGDDLIRGFGGNDRIIGEKGNDCLIGGIGDDIILGN
ncbi:MAG: hypothetical protein HYZ56_03490, partial [Nitrosopumilales archaeon]|nr:hypothetical protein [Nitrosopumilales archaeon]